MCVTCHCLQSVFLCEQSPDETNNRDTKFNQFCEAQRTHDFLHSRHKITLMCRKATIRSNDYRPWILPAVSSLVVEQEVEAWGQVPTVCVSPPLLACQSSEVGGRTWLLTEHCRWHRTAGTDGLKQTADTEGLDGNSTLAVATRGACGQSLSGGAAAHCVAFSQVGEGESCWATEGSAVTLRGR